MSNRKVLLLWVACLPPVHCFMPQWSRLVKTGQCLALLVDWFRCYLFGFHNLMNRTLCSQAFWAQTFRLRAKTLGIMLHWTCHIRCVIQKGIIITQTLASATFLSQLVGTFFLYNEHMAKHYFKSLPPHQ